MPDQGKEPGDGALGMNAPIERRDLLNSTLLAAGSLIDDNGDHAGTEHPDVAARPAGPGKPRDGTLARQTVIQKLGR